VPDMLRFLTYVEGYGQFALAREKFLELPERVRGIRCSDCGSCSVHCPTAWRCGTGCSTLKNCSPETAAARLREMPGRSAQPGDVVTPVPPCPRISTPPETLPAAQVRHAVIQAVAHVDRVPPGDVGKRPGLTRMSARHRSARHLADAVQYRNLDRSYGTGDGASGSD